MSWMHRLIETYDCCKDNQNVPESEDIYPISHTSQLAQIEIVLDGNGNFRRASVLAKRDQPTIIPCTDDSACRTCDSTAHPLCDKLKYVAGDFSEKVSGAEKFHSAYLDALVNFTNTSKHPKLIAILKYVKKMQVITDLIGAKVLFADSKGKLPAQWVGGKDNTPEICKAIISGNQSDAFVRWRVEHENDLASGTWEDPTLLNAWSEYVSKQESIFGICMITGQEVPLTTKHPKKIRHTADNAKLISSNDDKNYTFRGKFTNSNEAITIGFEATHKAHNALRWLIGRQSFRNDTQAIVSWAVSGKVIPSLCDDTMTIFGIEEETDRATDVGQAFAKRLSRAIAGYKSNLSGNENVVVMVLDSATPGRLAIPYYRDLKGSDFLERLEKWHLQYSWKQNFGKEHRFVGAPAPRDIAEAAYGRRLDDKLKKATVERLLPCIIDDVTVPRDLVESISRRVSNRVGLEKWEFEKCLGIACALYRGTFYQRKYEMTLEENRTSRDYLFGRLLAIAERIEGFALYLSNPNPKDQRQTNAARLTQCFADRPSSTWRTISLALVPYKAQLASKAGGFLYNMEQLLESVITSFKHDDFISDLRLSTEYQLGYYCQRAVLWEKQEGSGEGNSADEPSKTVKN
jgi:CRISPR-associated protein Csd1